jgi:hypothetical protein
MKTVNDILNGKKIIKGTYPNKTLIIASIVLVLGSILPQETNDIDNIHILDDYAVKATKKHSQETYNERIEFEKYKNSISTRKQEREYFNSLSDKKRSFFGLKALNNDQVSIKEKKDTELSNNPKLKLKL